MVTRKNRLSKIVAGVGLLATLGLATLDAQPAEAQRRVYTRSGVTRYDIDRDGIRNSRDRDMDGDGIRNGRDRDRDGDGVRNNRDRNPDAPNTGVLNRSGRYYNDRYSGSRYYGDRYSNDRYYNDRYYDGGVRSRVQGYRGTVSTWDIDGDGIPNERDRDMDGDGVSNERDAYPRLPNHR